jgi:hypothetical protein
VQQQVKADFHASSGASGLEHSQHSIGSSADIPAPIMRIRNRKFYPGLQWSPRAQAADTGVVSFPLRTSDEIPRLLLDPLFIDNRFRRPLFVHYFVL